jgi:hypothetical protein
VTPAQWARCRAWLIPAMSDTCEAEVLAELEAGRAQLWAGERSAMVSRLIRGPDELYALVWLGGGDLRELLENAPGAIAWARAQGCQAARINGRLGWARVLKAAGWQRHGGDLRKVL